MRNVTFAALVAASFIASACAHAQAAPANLCPAGTKTLKDIVVKGTDMGFPPYQGAEGESNIQLFDLDPSQQFSAGCNPKEEGFDQVRYFDVPKGSKSCSFNMTSGLLTCTK